MKSALNIVIVRILVLAFIMAIFGGIWDTNIWHATVGREGFFQPPHNVLYLGVLIALFTSIIAWLRTRERQWRNIALVIVLIPVSALLDDMWHRVFGIEQAGTVVVYWSPPHLATELMLLGAIILLLQHIQCTVVRAQEKTVLSLFLLTLIFQIFEAMLWPLKPTGIFRVIGMWGGIVEPAAFILIVIIAQRLTRQRHAGTLFAFFQITLVTLIYIVSTLYFDWREIPHDLWLRYTGPYFHHSVLFRSGIYILAAYIAERQQRPSVQGMIMGGVIGTLLYSVGYFLIPSLFYVRTLRLELTASQFGYTFPEGIAMAVLTFLAGLCIGKCAELWVQKKYSEKWSWMLQYIPVMFVITCVVGLTYGVFFMEIQRS